MQDLFGASGIHLNFLRVPMAGSDFTVSSDPYSYDDMPAGQTDPSLSQFSIAHDLPYIMPALQVALAVNPRLQILANPWSPPGWMKTNDALDNTNDQGTLLPSAYGRLADYFVKFIQAYESNGVPISAITPQNEPRTSGSGTSYPGLTLPEPDEANFISQYLQPALERAGLHPKIYGNDLSWDKLMYADSLASGPAAGDLNGIAWHCYFGSPTVMSQLQQTAPGLDQIADECSPEIRNFGAPEYLISTLRNWASVVAVWNLALDPQGGPHGTAYGCPGCTGVVTIDEQSHTVSFGSEYYQLGQVGAFVQPGAVRIDSPNFVTYGLNSSNIETVSPGLDDVAFLNPDGSRVLIAYNHSTAPISFGVESDGNYFAYTIPPQAMTTFTWQ
jgi:glucosylceramidase